MSGSPDWEGPSRPAFPMDYAPNSYGVAGMTIHQYAAIHFAAALLANPGWKDAPAHIISGFAIEQANDLFRPEHRAALPGEENDRG
jgi:hypothetical protein